MHTIKHPDGTIGITTQGRDHADRTQRIINARHDFNLEYCKAKGWPTDPSKLTFEQIMEIRSQDGWKSAGQE